MVPQFLPLDLHIHWTEDGLNTSINIGKMDLYSRPAPFFKAEMPSEAEPSGVDADVMAARRWDAASGMAQSHHSNPEMHSYPINMVAECRRGPGLAEGDVETHTHTLYRAGWWLDIIIIAT